MMQLKIWKQQGLGRPTDKVPWRFVLLNLGPHFVFNIAVLPYTHLFRTVLKPKFRVQPRRSGVRSGGTIQQHLPYLPMIQTLLLLFCKIHVCHIASVSDQADRSNKYVPSTLLTATDLCGQ
jgi:hypothetical protein